MTAVSPVDPDGALLHGTRDEYDVCVIGAGAAGLYLTSRLAQQGLRIALLDRGPSKPQRVNEGEDFDFLEDRYSGAVEGRDFGVGGSTARWGGLLVPYVQADVRGDSAWQHIVATVHRVAAEVLGHLGWAHRSTFADTWLDTDLRLSTDPTTLGLTQVSSLYLPFRKKNLAWLLSHARRNSAGCSPTLYVGCTACGWQVTATDPPRVDAVVIVDSAGDRRIIRARKFVIAAGALESTRCALELAAALPGGALGGHDWLGKGLSDHLSFTAGTFDGASTRQAISSLGFRFESGWMRGLRFVTHENAIARSFAHAVFESADPAFLLAREAMRALQSRRFPRISPRELAQASSSIPLMLFDRYARKRLRLSPRTMVRLQVDVEQAPDPSNSLTLLPHHRDRHGRPRLGIRWGMRAADHQRMAQSQAAYLSQLSSLPRFPDVRPIDLVASGDKVYDAYHPVGTCRLGIDDEAVVDPSLKLRGIDNVWVASTAVLPSAGSANPTFSMLCLAEASLAAIASSK
jgi:choline dehydrogenase-like flavoprotein